MTKYVAVFRTVLSQEKGFSFGSLVYALKIKAVLELISLISSMNT